MHFTVGNISTLVTCEDREIRTWISDWCTKEYMFYGIDFTKKNRPRTQKKAYLQYFQHNKFPSGWAGRLFKDLALLGYTFSWEDVREKPQLSVPIPKDKLWSLRDYQQDALKLALKKTRGIIKHATGAGKTVLMGHILADLGQPSLVLVPDINLLNQTHKDLSDFLNTDQYTFVGKIGQGIFEPRLITVGNIQSIWAKKEDPALKELFAQVTCICVDEGHHITIAGKNKIGNTYVQICENINAYYRFAFTATPGKPGTLEREILESFCGGVIHRVTSSELIERDYLTRPRVQIYPMVALRDGDYQRSYRINVLENDRRNEKIAQLAIELAASGKSVLVAVTRVDKHGKILKEMIPGSIFMHGKTSSEDRTEIFKKFSKKEILILISTVVKEGVNIPSMDVLIMAGGGKSDKATIQKVGRALRKSKNKDEALIIDFYDDDRAGGKSAGIMLKHSRARIREYNAEEAFIVEKM